MKVSIIIPSRNEKYLLKIEISGRKIGQIITKKKQNDDAL